MFAAVTVALSSYYVQCQSWWPGPLSGRLPVLVAAADVRVYVQSSGSATYELNFKLLNWQHLAHDAPLLASRDGGFTVMSTGSLVAGSFMHCLSMVRPLSNNTVI